MKNTYIKVILLVALCFNISCTDFLEEEVIDEISVDYIYSTPGGLEVGVNALYNLQRKNNSPRHEGNGLKANLFFMVGTDLGHTRAWHRPYGPPQNTASGFPSIKWTLPYQIIDRANAIINNAPAVSMDEDVKNNLVAQARVIRGELYLDLIRMYDNILLDTIATTAENAFDPIEYAPANPDDVFRLIDADLDFAIEHLDWNVPYGRYGKGAALHIRGKSAMWQGKWEEAADNFDAIIDNGTHGLLPDVSDVFGQDLNHREALFVYPRDLELGGGSDDLAGGGEIWFGSALTHRYYEISNEIISDASLGGNTLGWSYPNDYLKSLYDQENDERFDTYYYSEKLYVNNPDSENFGEPLAAEDYPDDYRQYHWSLKKFHDAEKPVNGTGSFKDYMYYRFAETLLLGAEAHWRASGENPGDPTALDYINRIRIRAGLEDDLFTAFTLDSYLEESARELAFEKNRWFLLKRVGLLVERQNMYYTYGSNSGNTTTYPMAPHMVRLPIPQSQIDLMGATFPQNEDY